MKDGELELKIVSWTKAFWKQYAPIKPLYIFSTNTKMQAKNCYSSLVEITFCFC